MLEKNVELIQNIVNGCTLVLCTIDRLINNMWTTRCLCRVW